jgi:RNAse (barnase) inhibitor barstar
MDATADDSPARKEVVAVDLSACRSGREVHEKLARALDFPDFYGRNWDAFWDAITGLVQMPKRLRVIGWAQLERRLPRDAELMRSCLDRMAREFHFAPDVEYR